MKKPTKTSTKPPPRTAVMERPIELADTELAKIAGGCTNENLTEAGIK